MDRTLVLVKPDGVQRGLIGEIISRLERRGLKIVGMKLMQVSGELANRHYGEHEGKPTQRCCDAEPRPDHIRDGILQADGLPEVTGESVAQPDQVLHIERRGEVAPPEP